MVEIGSVFEHERLEIFRDATTGATGIVAIHSTVLGPAAGGLRLHTYASIDAAVLDALRLSRVMSLKNAAAGLALGGGKAVLLNDGGWGAPSMRAKRMQAVGRYINDLGGRYITAEDIGTTPHDMAQIARATHWVAGLPIESGGRGDPSPATARTVFGAIQAAVRIRLGVDDLTGVCVGVQGVGHVGAALVALLCDAGAEVLLTDAVTARAADVGHCHGARAVGPAGFLERQFDVFAPCALGEVVSLKDVANLKCAVVAGAANNPLMSPDVADELARAGILYVPDFLANCGGIIHVGAEILGLDDSEVERLVTASLARTSGLLDDARTAGRSPWDVALEFARARIVPPPMAPLEALA